MNRSVHVQVNDVYSSSMTFIYRFLTVLHWHNNVHVHVRLNDTKDVIDSVCVGGGRLFVLTGGRGWLGPCRWCWAWDRGCRGWSCSAPRRPTTMGLPPASYWTSSGNTHTHKHHQHDVINNVLSRWERRGRAAKFEDPCLKHKSLIRHLKEIIIGSKIKTQACLKPQVMRWITEVTA